MSKSVVSILGCGWLGEPLAYAMVQSGYSVRGSSRRHERLKRLEQGGVQTYFLSLPQLSAASRDFFQCDTLLFMLPPSENSYMACLQLICDSLPQASQLIFISSTSVYPDINAQVDEYFPVHISQHKSILVEAERYLTENRSHWLILRPGGLMGGERYLLKYFRSRAQIDGAHTPVNHIHQLDAIGIIIQLVRLQLDKHIVNLVAPQHPSRAEVLTHQAKAMGVSLPPFVPPHILPHKIVKSSLLSATIEYSFLYPNPVQFPFQV